MIFFKSSLTYSYLIFFALYLTFIFILGLATLTSETFIVALLGVAGSFIVQTIKKFVPSLEGNTAFIVTIVTSVVLGLISVWVTGGLVLGAVPAILAVLGSATIVYQFLIKNLPELKLPNGNPTN